MDWRRLARRLTLLGELREEPDLVQRAARAGGPGAAAGGGRRASGRAGVIAGHVSLSAGQWATLALIVLVGSIPFSFLGLLIGQLVDAQAAQPIQAVTLMLTTFGGGLFFPMSTLPTAVQTVGRALPSYRMSQLGQEAIAGQALSAEHMVALAGAVTALGVVVLAAWRRPAAGLWWRSPR